MKLRPLGYRVLIKPDEVKKYHKVEGTDLKLELPSMNERADKTAMYVGQIVGIGPLAWRDYNKDTNVGPWAQVGDYVLYARYSGKWITDPETDEEYVIVDDNHILCKVDREVTPKPKKKGNK